MSSACSRGGSFARCVLSGFKKSGYRAAGRKTQQQGNHADFGPLGSQRRGVPVLYVRVYTLSGFDVIVLGGVIFGGGGCRVVACT